MSSIPGWLLRHQVTVEPYIGDGAYGPVYGPSTTVRAMVDEQTREVRAPDGEQVTSSSTVYCRPEVDAPPQSRVTLPSGAIILYNAYISLNKTPSLTVNEIMACEVTLSMLNEPVRYAS